MRSIVANCFDTTDSETVAEILTTKLETAIHVCTKYARIFTKTQWYECYLVNDEFAFYYNKIGIQLTES